MLREVAARLWAHVPPGGCAGRIDADEYAMAVPDAGDDVVLSRLGQRLAAAAAAAAPVEVMGRVVAVGASPCAARDVTLRESAEQLPHRADLASYSSKISGGDRVVVSSGSTNEPPALR